MKLLAGLIGSVVGAVIRRRTRCPGHVAHPHTRPLACRYCWQVME